MINQVQTKSDGPKPITFCLLLHLNFNIQSLNLNLDNFVGGMPHKLKSLLYWINLKNVLCQSLEYVNNDRSFLQLRLLAIRLFLFQIQNNNLSLPYYNQTLYVLFHHTLLNRRIHRLYFFIKLFNRIIIRNFYVLPVVKTGTF